MKKIILVVLFLLFSECALAQQTQQTAQQYNVAPINQAPNVTNANAVSDFEAGSTTRFYWIITHLAGVTSTPVQTSDTKGPVTLSSSSGGRVTVTWTSPNINATFDVLETSTATLPALANCACAVVTGATGTTAIDNGTYGAYSTTFVFGFPWNVNQSIVGGIPQLNFIYNGSTACFVSFNNTSTCGPPPAPPSGVTSVGLALPSTVFGVSGSPVTTSGTLTGSLQPQLANTFFSGPGPNSIGGVVDSVNNNSTLTPTLTFPFSVTPSTSNDFAIGVFATDHGNSQSSAMTLTGSGTWTSINPGNQDNTFVQQLASGATLNPVATVSTTATAWSGGVILLKTSGGSVSVVQSHIVSGSINTTTSTFSSNVTAGNAILSCITGAINQVPVSVFSDTQGGHYTWIGGAAVADPNLTLHGTYANCWLLVGAAGGTTTVNYTSSNGHGTSGEWVIAELSHIAADSGLPTFRPIQTADLPGNQGISVGSFINRTLAADLAVSASTSTQVLQAVVTMPSQGCPCRVFLSYSLFVNTASSGVGYEFWVNDGTTNMAGVSTAQSNGASGALTSATYGGFSTSTYANGAIVTFNLNTEGDHTYTIKATSPVAVGNAGNSSFQVSALTSN